MVVADMTEEQLTRFIQFQHPEKVLSRFGGPSLADDQVAVILGIDAAFYRHAKRRSVNLVMRAASRMLQDPEVALAVGHLPFAPGATVVGLGDSITDDDQSWLEILRHLLALGRPRDRVRVVNAGVSADTTAQMIARVLEVVREKPDWIIVLAGTNDARRHGYPEAARMADPEATDRNLRALRRLAGRTGARWIWMTPPPVIEAQITADWQLGPLELSFRNADLAVLASCIRQYADPVVDLQRVFGDPADPAYLLPDGLHPSLAGQVAIATALVHTLCDGIDRGAT